MKNRMKKILSEKALLRSKRIKRIRSIVDKLDDPKHIDKLEKIDFVLQQMVFYWIKKYNVNLVFTGSVNPEYYEEQQKSRGCIGFSVWVTKK